MSGSALAIRNVPLYWDKAVEIAISTPLPDGLDPPEWWQLGRKDELDFPPPDASVLEANKFLDEQTRMHNLSLYRKRIVLELLFARHTNTRTMGLFMSLASSTVTEDVVPLAKYADMIGKAATDKKRPAPAAARPGSGPAVRPRPSPGTSSSSGATSSEARTSSGAGSSVASLPKASRPDDAAEVRSKRGKYGFQ